MTASDDRLPAEVEVLVVGAGPAGSACARALALGGRQVLQIDRQAFARDKVCGDGLIPDALRALQRLGVHDEVMAHARRLDHVHCVSPGGQSVDVPGTLAVLPRQQLDALLKNAAERAGARFAAPWRFESPLLDADGRVVGAQLRAAGPPGADAAAHADRPLHTVRCRWLVLATGAATAPLQAAGLCTRVAPSAVALRGHLQHDGLARQIQRMEVVWHARLRGGYGWIFPGPGGVFNVGVGLIDSHPERADGRHPRQGPNLRALLQAFAQVHEPAGVLLREGRAPDGAAVAWKGAPLRCSLQGAHYSRPGLLAVGEAVGSTYAFSGEGIGKAMETGMLAADALLAADAASDGASEPPPAAVDAAVREAYAAALHALQPRFALYARANRINHRPWLADLLLWRASRDDFVLQRMAGVLDESRNPGSLVTLRGLAKLLLPPLRPLLGG